MTTTQQAFDVLLSAAERVSLKYGHDANDVPLDWTEWKDLRAALAAAKAVEPVIPMKIADFGSYALEAVEPQPERQQLPEFCACDDCKPMECDGCRTNRDARSDRAHGITSETGKAAPAPASGITSENGVQQ